MRGRFSIPSPQSLFPPRFFSFLPFRLPSNSSRILPFKGTGELFLNLRRTVGATPGTPAGAFLGFCAAVCLSAGIGYQALYFCRCTRACVCVVCMCAHMSCLVFYMLIPFAWCQGFCLYCQILYIIDFPPKGPASPGVYSPTGY